MDIWVEGFTKSYQLSNEFRSASGSIIEKVEFVLVFMEGLSKKPSFIMEFPLSPSHGEMPDDVIERICRGEGRNSKAFRNAVSYFLGMNDLLKEYVYFNDNIERRQFLSGINTVDIESDEIFKNYNGYIKVKSSSRILYDTISLINKSDNVFIVDFNTSISLNELDYFLDNVIIEKIYAIEQPTETDIIIPPNHMNMIADETFTAHGYNAIKDYGYNGFVFKPFANDYSSLYECVRNNHNFWGIVGSNVSGPIDCCFLNLINQFMPCILPPIEHSYFSSHPLDKSIDKLVHISAGSIFYADDIYHYLSNHCNKRFECLFSMENFIEIIKQ